MNFGQFPESARGPGRFHIEEFYQRMDYLTASNAHVTEGISKRLDALESSGPAPAPSATSTPAQYSATSRTVERRRGPSFPRRDLASHQQHQQMPFTQVSRSQRPRRRNR